MEKKKLCFYLPETDKRNSMSWCLEHHHILNPIMLNENHVNHHVELDELKQNQVGMNVQPNEIKTPLIAKIISKPKKCCSVLTLVPPR